MANLSSTLQQHQRAGIALRSTKTGVSVIGPWCIEMTGKGIQAQQRFNQKARRIREGKEQPMEYILTVHEALERAGL